MDPNQNQNTIYTNQYPVPTPNPLTSPQNPTPPTTQTTQTSKLKWFVYGLLGILLLTIVGVSCYYIGVKQHKPTSSNVELAPTPIITPRPTPKPTKTSDIPNGWSMQNSKACNLSMPLPPKTPPYYIPLIDKENPATDEGGYWMFEENSGDEMFNDSAIAIFRNPDLGGSEYVAGGIFISCSPNSDNLTADDLTDIYLAKYVTSNSELKLIKRETSSFWGNQVVSIYIEGGMSSSNEPINFLATKDKIYMISKAAMSTNSTVTNAVQIIFDNINFESKL